VGRAARPAVDFLPEDKRDWPGGAGKFDETVEIYRKAEGYIDEETQNDVKKSARNAGRDGQIHVTEEIFEYDCARRHGAESVAERIGDAQADRGKFRAIFKAKRDQEDAPTPTTHEAP